VNAVMVIIKLSSYLGCFCLFVCPILFVENINTEAPEIQIMMVHILNYIISNSWLETATLLCKPDFAVLKHFTGCLFAFIPLLSTSMLYSVIYIYLFFSDIISRKSHNGFFIMSKRR
jgi:hypothetical protein